MGYPCLECVSPSHPHCPPVPPVPQVSPSPPPPVPLVPPLPSPPPHSTFINLRGLVFQLFWQPQNYFPLPIRNSLWLGFQVWQLNIYNVD